MKKGGAGTYNQSGAGCPEGTTAGGRRASKLSPAAVLIRVQLPGGLRPRRFKGVRGATKGAGLCIIGAGGVEEI